MIKKIFRFLKNIFWTKPIIVEKEKKQKITEREVSHAYIIIQYKGKPFQVEEKQLTYFNSLPSKIKDKMVHDFNQHIKKGRLVLQEIDGKKLYVKGRGFDHKKYFNK